MKKKHQAVIYNPPRKIYVNEQNSIRFRIKTGYCLELLTPETMKLLRITDSKITEN